ncbi:MAG: DUF3160 domain-containing protein [bacterium]
MKKLKSLCSIFLFLNFLLYVHYSIAQLSLIRPFSSNNFIIPSVFPNLNSSLYSPFNTGFNSFSSIVPSVNPLSQFSFGTLSFSPFNINNSLSSLFQFGYNAPTSGNSAHFSLPGYLFGNQLGLLGSYPYSGINLFQGYNLSTIPSLSPQTQPLQTQPPLAISPQTQPPQTTPQTSRLRTQAINLSNEHTDNRFIKNYSLEDLDVPLKAAPYNLPLQPNEILNFEHFTQKISLSNDALSLLSNNGFAVIDNPFNRREENITQPYNTLKDNEVPIFITSDSLLHLYHIQFDETLRQIEEREFFDKIWDISQELCADSVNKYESAQGDLKEAYKRNVAYFSVGLSLLKPKDDQLCGNSSECSNQGITDAYFNENDVHKYTHLIPDFVHSAVTQELNLINAHAGFSESPIFLYFEDYSQYIPRGHYTRSEKLKNYFKAFMWYGRISMLLKGSDKIPEGSTDPYDNDGLISTYDAMIQTIQACIISLKFAEKENLKQKWDRIYSVTSFYVGLSDDLGPYEYREAIGEVFGPEFNSNLFADQENVGEIKAKLAEYMPPKIFGGTGDCGITPPFTLEQADECLEKTKGFRLMGQRFIPDSYMFSNLVGAYTGEYRGDRNCSEVFTCVISEAERPIRGFPRGLDVMALLGSERAKEILSLLGDDKYKNYTTQFELLNDEFSNLSYAEWNRNLYWSWLFALKPLLKEFSDSYPTFMQTKAWQDKELTTALASWAELRHDTILYAKQSYTRKVSWYIPSAPEKPVVGYIEPVPEFYNRLLSLTKMTIKGLDDMEVLDSSARYRLDSLESILGRLVVLSENELKNEELTQIDYEFIKNFGKELNAVIEDVDDKAKKTSIIADVHTDGNTGQVLEEGIGYVKLMVVAYRVPDGRILLGAGPVMSYYEFKHPMNDRLTDEKWRSMLQSNPPNEPEWVINFSE